MSMRYNVKYFIANSTKLDLKLYLNNLYTRNYLTPSCFGEAYELRISKVEEELVPTVLDELVT